MRQQQRRQAKKERQANRESTPEAVPAPRGRGGQRLGQEDRFWRMARQYLRGYMQGDFQQESDGGGGVTYEDDVNYYGTPGQGEYLGALPSQGSPYASLVPQVTPQAPGSPQTPAAPQTGLQGFWKDPMTGDPTHDLLFQTGEAPTASPVSYKGPPPDHVQMAVAAGQKYGVDPRLLLALAKHETGYGTLGMGKKGYTLGYGATDSGPIPKYAGQENQYSNAAAWMAKRGIKGIEGIGTSDADSLAASYATDPNWQQGIQRAYSAIEPVEQPPPPETEDEEDEKDED